VITNTNHYQPLPTTTDQWKEDAIIGTGMGTEEQECPGR